MAELMRIEFEQLGYDWESLVGNLYFTEKQLDRMFDIPGDVHLMDVVIHDRSAVDRLNVTVAEDEYGVFLNVLVKRCSDGRWTKQGFPWEDDKILCRVLERILKRNKMKVGSKLYIQIEY